MDDNAQASTFQPDTASQTQPVPNQVTPTMPPVAPAMQPLTRPVEQPGKTQQVSISGRPEQGPIAMVSDDDIDDDEQPVARQEASVVQPFSHPEVMVAQELKDFGVAEGADAKKDDLPEEHQQIEETVTQASAVQVTTQQAGEPTLPMSLGEAQLAAKKERSIKNGISWIVRVVIREWKKQFFVES